MTEAEITRGGCQESAKIEVGAKPPAFRPYFKLRFPDQRWEKSQVTNTLANSNSPQPARITADYLYQGATILAALLLVLSAAV